jgi:hypothetical protein
MVVPNVGHEGLERKSISFLTDKNASSINKGLVKFSILGFGKYKILIIGR